MPDGRLDIHEFNALVSDLEAGVMRTSGVANEQRANSDFLAGFANEQQKIADAIADAHAAGEHGCLGSYAYDSYAQPPLSQEQGREQAQHHYYPAQQEPVPRARRSLQDSLPMPG